MEIVRPLRRRLLKLKKLMKLGYTAISDKGDKINFFAHSTQTSNILGTLDAQNWIINHLDCSKRWNYYPNGRFIL